jgi:hypothetical protein
MYTVQYVKNPVYANQEKTVINCLVKFTEFDNDHSYTAASYDTVEHGKQIFNDLISGKYGPIGDYVAPPPSVPPTPTLEQLQAQLATLTAQITALANTGQ